MKKKRIGILLIMFLLMIISIGAISAVDTNDALVGQVSDTNIATTSVALEDNAPSLDSESGSDVEINVSDNQNELSNQKTEEYKSSNLNNDLLSASNDDLLGGEPVTMAISISGYCKEESEVLIFYDIMCEDDSDIDIETDYEFAVFICDDVSYFGSFFYLDDSEDMYGKDAYRAGVYLPYLAPGYHELTFIYRGSSDNGGYSMFHRERFGLAEGSQVILTDITPELTDGRIIMHYGDSKLVTFRAVSEKTGNGLKNVPFKVQIDDAPSNDSMTNDYGEFSVLLENVPAAGDYTLKISTADDMFPFEFEIPITVLATPAYLNVNTTSLDLEIDETGRIDAILLPSEAGDVTFASSDVDVVTIDSNGNYIAIGEGVANITVGYPGNEIYSAVEDVIIPVSVSRIKANISIDDDSLELNIGDEDIIDAKLTPEDAGNIIFTSSDEDVVTVDDEGNIVAVGEGEAEITLSFDGDEEKYEAPEDVVITVTVSKIDVSIILYSEDSLELSVGDEDSIVAELDPEDAGDIIFTSSDEDVVTVDDEGNIVAVGEGEANITLSFDGDDEIYDDAEEVVITVTVSKIDTSIILYSEDSLELFVGDEDSIVAELDPDDAGSITFTSSDEDVVTVDSEGNIVAVGEGQAEITLSFDGDDGKYNVPDDVIVSVSVSKIDTSIILNSEDSLNLFIGDEDSIDAELDPEDAGVITFTSSDDNVVTVDSEGNIVAVGEGEANITLSFDGDGKYVAAEDVVVTVTVSKIETNIYVNEDSFELFVGDEDSIVAELDPEDAGNVTFVSSDDDVVTVDSEGNINATGEGEAIITISFAENNMYKSSETTVTVTVSKKNVRIELMSDDSLELNVGDEETIIAYIIIDDGSEMIPFDLLDSLEYNAYTDDDDEDDDFDDGAEDIIEVDEDGNVKAVGEGEAIIIISFDGNDMYEAAEDVIVTVTVSMIDTSITLNSEDSLELNVGDEDSIDAELDPGDAGVITFTSSDESVVTVDEEGNLIAVGEGEAEITLSFDGDERYVAADDVIVSVRVSKIETSIDVNEDYFELFVGDEDSIVAELNPEDVGVITFVSSDESVVTVDDEGNINATGEGEAVITISFAGDNMYKSSETTVTVTVSKKNVRIELMSDDSLELNVGDDETITAYIILDDGSEMIPFDLLDSLEYNTYSEGIVEVDEEGNVKAVGEGEDTIVISFAGNEFYNAAENITVAVSVSLIDTSITLNSEDSLELFVGDEDSIDAVLDPEEAGDITFVSSDESVVTVDDEGNIVAVGEGEANITLSFAGYGKYRASDDVIVTVSVSMIDTSIILNSEDSLELNVGDEDSIVAELDPEDAGVITFTSSDESVVTVDEDGNLIAVGEGEANITLSFAGDERYVAAEDIVVSVSVSKIDTVIIVDDELELNVGDEDSIVAELDPDDAGDITFVSSDESVVTVDDEGNVVAVGEGEANITVSFAGDDKYVASEAIITVTVSKIDTSIVVDDVELDLNVGDEGSIVAELDPEDAGDITFISSNKSVIIIDNNGDFVAVGEGEANITVSFAGDDKYVASEAIITVTVSKIDTSIVVDDVELDLNVGDEGSIVAELDPEDAGVITFVSSDKSVVIVDSFGNVVAVGEGEANITVSFAGDDKYAAAEDVIVTVIVSKIDTNIDVNEDYFELFVGDEDSIVAELDPEEAGDITFVSSDESVVTVDSEGNINATGEGEAVITISFAGDNMYKSSETTVTVTVSKKNVRIELMSDDSLELNVGDEETITAYIILDDGSEMIPFDLFDSLNYNTYSEGIVEVDEEGNVKAVGEGEDTIVISFAGNEFYNAAENITVAVSVSLIDTSIVLNSEDSLELNVGDEDSIDAVLDPEDAGNVTFVSSDESVVTVDSEGNLIAVGEGEAEITLSFAGYGKYRAADNFTVIVSVSMIDTSIVLNSEDSLELFVGDEDSIDAVLDPEDAGVITFTSSDESVVTVDENGNVVAVGEGEANITLSFAGDEMYNAADNVTVSVVVSKVVTIIIVDEELELNVGDEDSIDAKIVPEEAGDITFSSSDESVITIDDEGNVKAVGEGEANITLSFAGDDKYVASETVITVTVSKIDTNIDVDDELELNVGDEDSIVAELDPEDAGVITFVSSDESVVTVDDEGNVVAVGEGEAEITLSFAGDDKYAPSEATVAVTVSKIDTHIEIMGDDSLELFVGDKDNIDAFVVIDASGMIPITLLNSLNYVSSDESVVTVDEDGNVKAVGEGEAVIAVSFAGDDIYAASEDEIILVSVIMKDAAVYAGPKSLDLYVGEDGEIYYFTIPEDLDVEITSSDESVVTVKNDDGFVIVTAVGGGNATITLTVGDNVTYVINSTTVSVSVSKIATEIIADDLLILDVGDVTIIEFTTTPEYMNVTYESNDTSVAIVDENGIVTAVSNGTALITLKIEEDATYEASQATVMVSVYPEKEELNITVDADDIFFGEDAIILIWGLEDATGNITVTIDGIDYIAAILDGMASFDIPDLDIGEYLIPINYSGDDKYGPINIYINLTVDGDKSDVITAPNVTKYYGDSDRFVVVVTDYKGNPVAGENVSFLVNNVTYTRTTDKDGLASIALNMPSGVYNITVTVDNKTTTSQVNILSTVNGTDVVKVLRNETQYYATFRDSEGNYLKQGTTVRFNINGVIYDRQISGDEGVARLNINLPQGQYIITAMNLVTGENTANKITVIPRLVENSDITKYYKNGTQYTVKVINNDGTAVGAGVLVTFNINGVFYTRTTNESGIVLLNINLQPGDYIITAEYLDCKVSNKIKVLSVLSASDLSMKYRDGSKFTAKLVDGQGKAYAGQTVTFNINGVLYNRQTDSSGQAKLNINLMAGEYIITSSYNGSSISNTITITA